MSLKSISVISMVSLILSGCPSPSPVIQSKPNTSDKKVDGVVTQQANQENDKELNIDSMTNALITIENEEGEVNPLVPEDIEYIMIDDVKINGSDIVLLSDNTFATKSLFNSVGVFFSGLFSFFSPSKPSNSIVTIKPKASNNTYKIPVYNNNGGGNFISANIKGNTISGSYVTGIIAGNSSRLINDGAGFINGSNIIAGNSSRIISNNGNTIIAGNSSRIISNNGNTLQIKSPVNYKTFSSTSYLNNATSSFISTGSKISITYADNSKNTYSVDSYKINKSTSSIKLSSTEKQNELQTTIKNTKPLSPIAPLAGKWIYKANFAGFNEEIKVEIYDRINNKYRIYTKIKGEEYKGDGVYSDSTTSDDLRFEVKYKGQELKIKLSKTGTNKATVTLLNDKGLTELKPYINIPFALKRDI